MEVMERDPAYIARQVKFLRKMYHLTQENLAEASGLTTRTIEKIESGRHKPEEQTLRSLARAFQIDAAYFEKPSPEEEARQKADIVRSIRKTLLVPTDPVRSVQDFLSIFGQRDALRFDSSSVQNDAALEIAASMQDWLTDIQDVWSDMGASDQLRYGRNFLEICGELEQHGYLCHMGTHRQMLRTKGRPDLNFVVGLVCLLPRGESDGRRYAIIHLDGGWETVMEDRIQLPDDFL